MERGRPGSRCCWLNAAEQKMAAHICLSNNNTPPLTCEMKCEVKCDNSGDEVRSKM